MSYEKKIYEEITALVDNEIDSMRRTELMGMIETDADLQKEYFVQSDIKNLLHQRFSNQKAPAYLYEGIMERISFSDESVAEHDTGNKLKDMLLNLFQPKYALALIAIFAVIFFLSSPFQSISESVLIEKQEGRFNMWVQANSNFEKIVSGDLSAQIISNRPEELKQFFANNGVDYSVQIPECKNWSLLGGVVSEDKGSKFAHHVYADEAGHIVYVYQANENYFQSGNILKLSDDLFNYISEGNVLQKEYDNRVSFILKSKENIYTVVANEDPQKIQSDLISQLL